MRKIFIAAQIAFVMAGIAVASVNANAATYSVWGANITYPEQQASAGVSERGEYVALAPDEVQAHKRAVRATK
jgi:hypothetical protein